LPEVAAVRVVREKATAKAINNFAIEIVVKSCSLGPQNESLYVYPFDAKNIHNLAVSRKVAGCAWTDGDKPLLDVIVGRKKKK
jgi:hypothetical protein